MFCYQCEQTAKESGCTAHGVCGKSPDVAEMQDLLMYAMKDISRYAHGAAELGKTDTDIDRFLAEGMFATVTNVNFDAKDLGLQVKTAADFRNRAKALYETAAKDAGKTPETFHTPVEWWKETENLDKMVQTGEQVGIQNRMNKLGEDITGLQELLTYGMKGIGSYSYHADILGKRSEDVDAFIREGMSYLTQEPKSLEELLGMNLKCGEANLKMMELLDAAHTETYGHPEPTKVRVTPVKGKCIAVSGHDLKDLEEILKQTEDKDINVYTHGEMLMCNSYPGLKKYDHFKGNYGGAWQDQRQDFDAFPGAILMTTNCIQKPKGSYEDRIFTSGPTAWPGLKHVHYSDFSPVIEAAEKAEGFTEDYPEAFTMTGFAHNAVMSVADQVVDAVKNGQIRHFFLIGGCDGAKPGRNYYTDFAKAVPRDCVILTLACGKYRFNKLDFGDIGGIPRMLDCGQCNDAYSAIQIALALSKAFDTDVNELPLSFVLSWFEQKAVAILLTLLHLGIKDMRLGPTLPAYVTPSVLKVLQENYNLMPITTPETDMKAILGE
ncbi:MAG: hydroxylamine reductase [Thermodesulfobacteriota bacterium]